jgi:hypothetical protein
MKLLLCNLLVLTLAGGVAMAQTPVPQGTPGSLPAASRPYPYGQTNASPGVFGQPQAQTAPINGQAQVQAPMMNGAGMPATVPASCCTVPCCEPVCKTCVREPATKTINHVCYCNTCTEFCLPRCSCCGLFGCGNCQCEGPFAKYWLVKKVIKEQCPTTKCVPSVAPACGGCVSPLPR